VKSRFVAGLKPKPSELLIEAILYSLIIELLVTIVSTLWVWLFGTLTNQSGTNFSDLMFFLNIVVLPGFLGAILGNIPLRQVIQTVVICILNAYIKLTKIINGKSPPPYVQAGSC
jgi:hypothetical protein